MTTPGYYTVGAISDDYRSKFMDMSRTSSFRDRTDKCFLKALGKLTDTKTPIKQISNDRRKTICKSPKNPRRQVISGPQLVFFIFKRFEVTSVGEKTRLTRTRWKTRIRNITRLEQWRKIWVELVSGELRRGRHFRKSGNMLQRIPNLAGVTRINRFIDVVILQESYTLANFIPEAKIFRPLLLVISSVSIINKDF